MLARLLLLTAVGLSAWGFAATEGQKGPTNEQVAAVESFLFVQNASSGTFDGERLTLAGSGPTMFFSDRPYRVFGHVTQEQFVDAWKRGPNSFATDPPNAVLSLIGEQNVVSCLVELSDPVVAGGKLSYKVKVEKGKLPARFEQASLFIDNEAWAAVGGFAAGHLLTRRHEEQREAAYAAGAASSQQTSSYYYHASTPPPVPTVPSVPAPPSAQPSVEALLAQAVAGMQAYTKQAPPQDAEYVQKLITTVQTVSADYKKVAQ